MPSGFQMSKIRNRRNPAPVTVNLARVSSVVVKRSETPQNTSGMATNSSIITSPGSRLQRMRSAAEQIGIASKASSEKPHKMKDVGRCDHSNSTRKASAPAREPKVPGAGQDLPKGPNVARASHNRFDPETCNAGGGVSVTSLPRP